MTNLKNNLIFPSIPENPDLHSLTNREWTVLINLTYDKSDKEVAKNLSLTLKSFNNYKNRIGGKLDMQGRGILNRFARLYSKELHQWFEILSGNIST